MYLINLNSLKYIHNIIITEMAEANGHQEIREGFICPICHRNLQSARGLVTHFEDQHSEQQDVLQSLKGKQKT